jgi:hypothetical protein
MGVCKTHSTCGQSIHVGGWDFAIGIEAAHVSVAEVVGKYVDEIWTDFVGCLRVGGECGEAKQRKNQAREGGFHDLG